jgi:hypothetical protein
MRTSVLVVNKNQSEDYEIKLLQEHDLCSVIYC